MESEKVKEIKKVLEMFAIDDKEMTLFQSPVPQGESCVKTIKYADILTLINELESENETKTHTIVDLLKKQEFYETEKLKQFATLLKEKTVLTSSGWCVNIEDIEKTLKEFIEK